MLDHDIQLAKEIREGQIELICREMELLVCPTYDEAALKGMGVIRSGKLGGLYFRMTAPFVGRPHPSLGPQKAPEEAPGPTDYVMLRAVDEFGREWRSNWLYIDLSRQIPLPNYSVHAGVQTLLHSHERTPVENSEVRIVIPNAPRFPFNAITKTSRSVGAREDGWSITVDHHTREIGGARVTFRDEGAGLVSISASRESPLEGTWPGLMCQSLSFAAAETIRPAVIAREFNEREDLELRSGPFLRYTKIMPCPIYFNGPEGADNFWRLVEQFVKYAARQQPTRKLDLLFDELQGIRAGSQGSFQTACLTLALGVESISRLLLGGRAPERVCDTMVRGLLEHVEGWAGDSGIKTRAVAMLSGLTDVRVVDLMFSWARDTGAPNPLIDRWKKLRNRKAHGGAVDDSTDRLLYYSVVELLHRIVATEIGYDGPIMKTSEPGWAMVSLV